MTLHRHRWLAALPALLAASCVAIGPTIHVEPGPGRSAQAFDEDRAECGRATDAKLQPEADALNGAATNTGQFAANNARIQSEYNADYGQCVAEKGDEPERGSPTVETASKDPSPPPIAPASAAGYTAGGWSFLTKGYHKASTGTADPLDAQWRAEIASPPAGPGSALAIESVAVDIGDHRAALVSMALVDACDAGPNTATSKRDYASCPGKLSILRDGVIGTTRDAGPLCGEVINDGGTAPDSPFYKDPKSWGTRIRYDPARRVLRLLTMQDGRVEHACNKTLAIDPGR
jgi:hypothetical protein